jgi:hypothetical protein
MAPFCCSVTAISDNGFLKAKSCISRMIQVLGTSFWYAELEVADFQFRTEIRLRIRTESFSRCESMRFFCFSSCVTTTEQSIFAVSSSLQHQWNRSSLLRLFEFFRLGVSMDAWPCVSCDLKGLPSWLALSFRYLPLVLHSGRSIFHLSCLISMEGRFCIPGLGRFVSASRIAI